MMKSIFPVLLIFCSFSCTEEVKEESAPVEKQLIVKKNGMFTEYYPGAEKVKIQGEMDDEERRHGKWSFYDENGMELSFTFYMNGLKNGHSLTKYPDGRAYYYGEYENDTMVGIWKSYDSEGNAVTKDYGRR
jgi:antitoxin component YwqK of YwqJK toxin-antitoxin module